MHWYTTDWHNSYVTNIVKTLFPLLSLILINLIDRWFAPVHNTVWFLIIAAHRRNNPSTRTVLYYMATVNPYNPKGDMLSLSIKSYLIMHINAWSIYVTIWEHQLLINLLCPNARRIQHHYALKQFVVILKSETSE